MKTLIPARFSFPAVALVGGIYIHFLLFAQFGFLQGIRAAGHPVGAVHLVLGAMAIAGIVTGFLAAVALARADARVVAAAGLACAAAAGGLATIAFRGPGADRVLLLVIALFTGAGLGAATVATSVLLRRFVGSGPLALHVGLGTGLAYLVCNMPAIFNATPANKGWMAALAALLGLGAAVAGRARKETPPREHYTTLTTRTALACATVAFLALVWFDSAAFSVVQTVPAQREAFWDGSRMLWTIGVVHAGAAVAAGLLIDRGALRATLAAAFALIVAGHFGFEHGASTAAWAAPAYVAGVSLYSTALAAFAALAPATRGLAPPWRAAWIYALAGWMGSAAGVGLAEEFGRVPAWAAPAAAVILAAALTQLRPNG